MDEIDDRNETPSAAGARVSLVDLLPANPSRPLDWRWLRAGQLLEPGVRRRRWDDRWVARARRFRTALGKGGGDVQRPRLARACPEILGAYLLRQGDPRRRREAEARLLAGQNDDEIAARVGLEAGVIEAYEALFFGVRSHLGATDWIMARAIGVRAYAELGEEDIEIIWKLGAYHLGPLVLDAVIDVASTGGPPVDPRLAGQIKLLAAAMTTSVTPENALPLVRVNGLAGELERAEAARGVGAVTRPIGVQPLEFPIGPDTLQLEAGRCRPIDPGSDAPADEGSDGLSSAG